ncbi:secretion protein HlyD family protein, partial [mine drainage metagenome]
MGDFGYKGELVAAGQTLATVADLSRSYVLAYVNETRASSLAVGQTADLYLASNPGHALRGTVQRIYPAVAAATWPLPAIQTGAFSQQTQWVPIRVRIHGSGEFYLGGAVTVG